jgi:copper chaperone CopZ
LEGVSSVKADAAAATVSVEYNPDQVNPDQIRAAVTQVGYKFLGENPVQK